MPTPKVLSLQDIEAAPALETELVPTPEWGGAVLMGAMDGEERALWDLERWIRSAAEIELAEKEKRPVFDYVNGRQAHARMFVFSARNPDGSRMFPIEERTDELVERISKRNGDALRRCADVGERLSGLGQKAVDKAAGKSEGTEPSGSDSSSASPSMSPIPTA